MISVKILISAPISANREGQRAAALLQRRDANGNILPGSESYMKTVYRAFPLGDGLA